MTRPNTGWMLAASLFAVLFCVACVSFPDAPASMAPARVDASRIITSDGASLGLRVTPAPHERAIIIAVHGMNDYSNAFAQAAAYWASNGITTYAYDQRGFGDSDQFGRWPGAPTLIRDLNETIKAVHAKSPDTPVILVGHSMGAGVVMAAMAQDALDVDGVVLAAPGLWGG
ncbi:MAG: alpha/beta fold hydrolase, partial [Parvularculaceae bacterium]|nr:alpha/beta fold hydrolase [Parvularculaceae bacterium]